MIGIQPIDPEADQSLHRGLGLGVPPECSQAGFVGCRDVARRPVVPVHVERIGGDRGETLEQRADPGYPARNPARPGRANEAHLAGLPAELAEEAEVVMAGPQPSDGAGRRRDVEHRKRDGRMLQVERQLERATEGGVEIGEAWDAESRELVCGTPGDEDPAAGRTDRLVVDEHRHTVGTQPCIRLDAGSALLQGKGKGRQRVLRPVAGGAAMGEEDRLCDRHRPVIVHAVAPAVG